MKYYKQNDLKKLATDDNYRHFGLFDNTGKKIIGYNSITKDKSVRINEIINRLKSEALPDGIYIIYAKHNYQKSTTPDYFHYKKGNVDLSEKTQQPNQQNVSGELPADYIELKVNSKVLIKENEYHLEKIQELKQELAECQES